MTLTRRKRSQHWASQFPSIALKRFEAGRHAFMAVPGDVQVGWCVKRDGKWHIQDMDCQDLAGPFSSLRAADEVSKKVLAEFAGESSPGW
jgi:hypothetical protein